MSVQASIDIVFEEEVDVMSVIQSLISGGWSPNDNGQISYLPLNDGGRFDWTNVDLTAWSDVVEIIKNKIHKNETVGISMSWIDTMIGGEFLFWQKERKLSICLTLNRQKKDGARDTDFSWYVPRTIDVLKSAGFRIKSFVENQLG